MLLSSTRSLCNIFNFRICNITNLINNCLHSVSATIQDAGYRVQTGKLFSVIMVYQGTILSGIGKPLMVLLYIKGILPKLSVAIRIIRLVNKFVMQIIIKIFFIENNLDKKNLMECIVSLLIS